MEQFIERVKALGLHLEQADQLATPVNVVHIAREAVAALGEVCDILAALGVFDVPKSDGEQPAASEQLKG